MLKTLYNDQKRLNSNYGNMQIIKQNKYLIFGIIVGATVVYLLSTFTTDKKLNQLQLTLDTSLDQVASETKDLALLIGRGGLTAGAESIIADCTDDERDSFESKLAALDTGLSEAELSSVDTLFSRCAPVQPVRRTLMVMELSRLIETLDTQVHQRKQLGDYKEYDDMLATLRQLLILEEEMTRSSFDLVYLQREIIDVLLSGQSVTSDQANQLRERGGSIRRALDESATEAATLRSYLGAA
jgi:hypothetical protein